MKKLIHLSDLHFGTDQKHVTNILLEKIAYLSPDIIVVSGDLTQRARIPQFQEARDFLKKLNCPSILCVPGNHDISLYNLFERFFYPFNKYKKFISKKICNTYYQDNLAIFGVNSVTPYKPMSGYVTENQLNKIFEFFNSVPSGTIRIVVMHHNLIRSERHKIINNAEKIINQFGKCHVNLILSGHIHHPHAEQLKRKAYFHNMYIITAGTPISTRTTVPNSFNVIEISDREFKLNVMQFDKNEFIQENEIIFPI